MKILRSGCVVVGLICCLPAAFAAEPAAARRPLVPDDFYRLEAVSEPRVAPDGQWVAYLVTENDREADEQRSAVWMVSWDGSQRVQLTNPAAGTRAPRWSPDGRYLAYLATPAGADKGQVMLLDRRGGEPRPLTSSSDDINGYEWSPDGQRLVLVVQASGEEANEAPKHGAAPSKPPKPIVIDAQHFKEDEDGYLGTGHGQHLYLLDVASKKLEALTSDPAFNEDSPAWSPDGRRIAFVRTREKGPDADGMEDLDVVDARPGAAPRTLVRPYAPNVQHVAWSPDGTAIAYLQGLEPKYNAYMQDRLALVPADGGRPRALSDRLDRAVSSYAFASDSTSITITVEDDGSMYPARILLASGAIERLGDAPGVVTGVVAAGGHVVVLASSDTTATEVHALEGGRLRRLTGHNDALLAEIEPGAVEELRFRSRDGTEIHGFMVKPPAYVAGRRYPTVLWIHGGPNGQDEHSFAFDAYQFRRQLLAASGYVVVGINYRGSSGRGLAFATAIARRLGPQGGGGPAGRRRPPGRARGRGPGAPRHRRLELRRHPDRLHDRVRRALQGGRQRRRQRQSAVDVRQRRVRPAVQPRARAAVAQHRAVAQAVVPVLPRRPDPHADSVHGRGQGLQRADRRRRADVRGAQDARRADGIGRLPRPVPRAHPAELPQGSRRADQRLVRSLPAAGAVTAHARYGRGRSGVRMTAAQVRMAWVALLLSVAWTARAAPPPPAANGFTAEHAAAEQRIEDRFKGIPSAAEERVVLRYLTAEPHPAGSVRNHELAEYVADSWRRQGWRTS